MPQELQTKCSRKKCETGDVLKDLKRKLLEYESRELLIRQVLHDINNLMQILMSHIELSGFLDDAESAKVWELLFRNMKQTLCRLNDGENGDEKKEIDTVGLLNRFIMLMQSRYPAVQFRFLTALEDVFVLMTENQFFLILLNLFTNACCAMEQSKEKKLDIILRLCQKEQKKFYCLSLHDTGCGIDPALRVKIFQPYFTTKFDGKGLGLLVVKSMLEELGGHIEVESELNIGTTFHLYFPITS